MTVKVSGPRLGYKKLPAQGLDMDALKEKLVKRFAQREQNDLDRLQLVVQLSNHPGCKTRYLLRYFGEDLEADCGHCQFCLHGENTAIGVAESAGNGGGQSGGWEERKEALLELRREQPEALASARQLTRFLCGLSAPRLTRVRLTKHALFGCMAEESFMRVMERVEKMNG